MRMMICRAALMGAALASVAALADEPGVNVKARLAAQKAVVHVAVNDPPTVSVKAKGPALNADVKIVGKPAQCLTVLYEIAPGVCVPVGPEVPVSPN